MSDVPPGGLNVGWHMFTASDTMTLFGEQMPNTWRPFDNGGSRMKYNHPHVSENKTSAANVMRIMQIWIV